MGQCRTLDADVTMAVIMVITGYVTTLCPFIFGTNFFPSF